MKKRRMVLSGALVAATVVAVSCTPPTTTAPEFARPREQTCLARGIAGASSTAYCWGRNDRGQAVPGGDAAIALPTEVTALTNPSGPSPGGGHTCAVDQAVPPEPRITCWGRNDHRQLGPEATVGTDGVGRVQSLFSPTSVQSGASHTCAISSDTTVWCWGSNRYGQLGSTTTNDQPNPVHVPGLSGVTQLALGNDISCAIASGELRCWGRNVDGELGLGVADGAVHAAPSAATGIGTVSQVAAGWGFVCAVSAGSASCWGDDSYGKLGGATGGDTSTPTLVDLPGVAVTRVGLGHDHACLVGVPTGESVSQGYCWGRNQSGQLGSAPSAPKPPTLVEGLVGALRMIPFDRHTCALTATTVLCFGDNSLGQLGNGTRVSSWSPVEVVLPA